MQAYRAHRQGPDHALRAAASCRRSTSSIENALGGGVTISLAQDAHGKSLCYVMLAIELPNYRKAR